MPHYLSPAGVAAMLILAFVIDYLSIGPNSLRDKIAFLIALPMLRMGFDGGPLDTWTVQALSSAIEAAKTAGGGSYIAGAATHLVLSVLVACLAIYAIGAILPSKAEKRFGDFAKLALPSTAQWRINWKLWTIALALGILSDLAGGVIGTIVDNAITTLAKAVSVVPGFLFGVS